MSKDKDDFGNVIDELTEESHVRRVKKDAYYVASSDGSRLTITTVQLKENNRDNNYAEWAKDIRLAL